MNLIVVFLIGCIGALAPEILRLYSLRNNPDRFKWSWFFIGISILFASLGGLVALLLPATTYWGAFYVGISTPVLINTALKKGLDLQQPQLKSKRQIDVQGYSLLSSFLRAL